MVRDINSLGGPPRSDTRTTHNSAGSQSSTDNKSSPLEQSNTKAVTQDNVQLSSQGRNLQTLTNKLSDVPEINENRVAQIKIALERNTLNINSANIADKMLAADEG